MVCLSWIIPARGFSWQTATARGRDYVTLQSFCQFYGFGYANPGGNSTFDTRNPQHFLRLKMGSPDMFLDGVHYVMSFPVESGGNDWLVSRMDVIKLFEPIMRPQEIASRHAIRGVVIDPGHGGTDNGATSRLGSEKNYTIDTAYRLQAILNAAGIKTVMTRRNDIFVDLYERAHIASQYSDYAFVSIHFNSASEEARGLETYCLSPRGAASTSSSYLTRADIQTLPGNDDDALNVLLASAVHSEVIKLNPGDTSMDRGVKRARFVVIKATQIPAILVEGGFVSNRMESARVNSPGYRQALAQCIARGLTKYINIMGGRHMSLPAISEDAPPRAPIAPPASAPSGLQRDMAPGVHPRAQAVNLNAAGKPPAATASIPTSSNSSSTSHKKKKTKLAKTPAKPVPAAPAPASSPAPTQSTDDAAATGTKTSSPLGLSEGATPTPTPGAEKAPPEPDEPPTINTAPPRSSAAETGTTNAPSEAQP